MYSTSGATTLINCTVSANSAPTGGGLLNAGNSATVTLTNTIVAAQTSGGDVSGNFTGDHNLIGGDPKLAPLGDFGGPTLTMALLPGSLAIGGGTTGPNIPANDQRGQPRPASVDIGAFQGEGTALVVDTTVGGIGSGVGQISLPQAINLANAEPTADTITFDPNVFQTPQTITLGTQLELADTAGATTIDGPAAGLTISASGTSRVLLVDTGVTASLSGLTMTGGNSGGGNGGGVYNNGGTLSLSDCTISGNSSNGASGGGLSSVNGTLSMTNVTVSDNSQSGNGSQFGGGVAIKQGIATLSNCTISGNSILSSLQAIGYGGGASCRA